MSPSGAGAANDAPGLICAKSLTSMTNVGTVDYFEGGFKPDCATNYLASDFVLNTSTVMTTTSGMMHFYMNNGQIQDFGAGSFGGAISNATSAGMYTSVSGGIGDLNIAYQCYTSARQISGGSQSLTTSYDVGILRSGGSQFRGYVNGVVDALGAVIAQSSPAVPSVVPFLGAYNVLGGPGGFLDAASAPVYSTWAFGGQFTLAQYVTFQGLIHTYNQALSRGHA